MGLHTLTLSRANRANSASTPQLSSVPNEIQRVIFFLKARRAVFHPGAVGLGAWGSFCPLLSYAHSLGFTLEGPRT